MPGLVDDSNVRRCKGIHVLLITSVIKPFYFVIYVFFVFFLLHIGIESMCIGIESMWNLIAKCMKSYSRTKFTFHSIEYCEFYSEKRVLASFIFAFHFFQFAELCN